MCKCVLYYCHRVSTQLQLTNIAYHIISYLIISYHIRTLPLDTTLEGTIYVCSLVDGSFKAILMLFYHIHKYLSNCPLNKTLYVCVIRPSVSYIVAIISSHHIVPGWNSLMKYMVIKWGTIRRTERVTNMGEKCMQGVVWKPDGKGPFWKEQTDDNIKVDLTESCLESVDWIYLTMDREKWRAIENTIKKFGILYNMGNFLTN